MAPLALYQRRREMDWVQATSWVRCSTSLATSGASDQHAEDDHQHRQTFLEDWDGEVVGVGE